MLRPWLVAAAVFILLGLNGYLLYAEYNWHELYHGIAPSEFQAKHVTKAADPLIDMRYTTAARQNNMASFGLPEPMIKRTLDRMRDIDDRHKDRLRVALDNAPDPNALADALCGQTNQVRPHYGALRFFVEEDKGQRRPIRPEVAMDLQWQDWSKISPISEVYNHAELAEERKPDTTLMAVAAILLKKEEDLLNDYKPWGRGFAGTWSWDDVKEKYPGIEEIAVNYFALMHVAVEMAVGEDGLCGQ